jgi:hypothetical protein
MMPGASNPDPTTPETAVGVPKRGLDFYVLQQIQAQNVGPLLSGATEFMHSLGASDVLSLQSRSLAI